MPKYTITPNPETHEFILRRKEEHFEEINYHVKVILFPYPKCFYALEGKRYQPCTGGEDCDHIEAVERALVDARNAPETPENRAMIETAYIPLRIAQRRRERAKRATSDAPIDELTKRQDWMD